MSRTDHSPRLLIDKITVTFDDPDPGKVPAIVTTLVSKAKTSFKGADVCRSESYAAFVTIPIPENDPTKSQKLVLQVGPYDPAWSSYRIEFNPSKVGPEGVADLDLIPTSALGIDAATFLSEGNSTRLDLAVDLPTPVVAPALAPHDASHQSPPVAAVVIDNSVQPEDAECGLRNVGIRGQTSRSCEKNIHRVRLCAGVHERSPPIACMRRRVRQRYPPLIDTTNDL